MSDTAPRSLACNRRATHALPPRQAAALEGCSMDHPAVRLALLSTVLVASPLAWTGARGPRESPHRVDLAVAAVPWRLTKYTIVTLPPEQRFELRDGRVTTAWPPTPLHDRNGVPMRIMNGVR